MDARKEGVMGEIVPVILCGGVGSRLWPLSRKKPAQTICSVIGTKSLFEATVTRVDRDEFTAPIVIASSDHRFLAEKQMRDCGRFGPILLEPEGKSTAPAVLCRGASCDKT